MEAVEAATTHTTMRADDDRVIAATTSELRRAARSLAERDPELGLLAFGGGGNHFHTVLMALGLTVAEYARRASTSMNLALRPGTAFARYRAREIDSQSYLMNAILYTWRQDDRHERALDPYREATNLPDLLGLRFIAEFTIPRLRRALPRLGRDDLLQHMPNGHLLDESSPLALRHIAVLPDAAAATLALPSLRGNRAEAVLARAAAVQIARRSLNTQQTCDLLQVSTRSCRNLATRTVPLSLTRAVEGQARLRAAPPALAAPQQPAPSGGRP